MTTPGSTYTDGAEEQTSIVPLPDTILENKSSPALRLDDSCTDLQQLAMTIRQERCGASSDPLRTLSSVTPLMKMRS